MRPYNVLTLPKFIALGMLAYTLINGVFFFVLQGDWGILKFCLLFFSAFYLVSIGQENILINNEDRNSNIC